MPIDSRTADAVIAGLARSQHGTMHRAQLLERQLSERQIDRRLGAGRLVDLGHSVYAVPSAPATYLRQYKAAELAVPGAAVCALAASVLLGLGAVRSAKPEIVVHPSANHRCRLARVHRRREVDLTRRKGIRVTTVAQTLVDIARRVRIVDLEDCWTGALIRSRTNLDELAGRVELAEVQRLRHRGRARAMLDSLTHGAGVGESELEARLLRLLVARADLPPIVPQLALPFWASGRGRADVGIPAWKVIIEVDGRSWHARLRDFDRDRERDNVAVAHGWVVLRFTALHLREDPERVVELVIQTGALRASV